MLWDKKENAHLKSIQDKLGNIKNPFMTASAMETEFKGRVKPTAACTFIYKDCTDPTLDEIMARLKSRLPKD